MNVVTQVQFSRWFTLEGEPVSKFHAQLKLGDQFLDILAGAGKQFLAAAKAAGVGLVQMPKRERTISAQAAEYYGRTPGGKMLVQDTLSHTCTLDVEVSNGWVTEIKSVSKVTADIDDLGDLEVTEAKPRARPAATPAQDAEADEIG